MKVLVTGESGFVGKPLVTALRLAGHDVVAPRRDGPDAADLENVESYRAHLCGVEAVVHLAAFNPRAYRISAYDRQKAVRLNVEASAGLARLAMKENCKIFIFASSARVYGIGHSPYDEKAPLLARDIYGQTKIAAESAILQSLFGSGTNPVIFRLPMFQHKPGGVVALAKKLASYGIPLPGCLLRARKSIVNNSDLASVILKTLGADKAFGGIYNVAAGNVSTISDLCAQANGRQPRILELPDVIVRILARAPRIGYAWKHAVSDCELILTESNLP